MFLDLDFSQIQIKLTASMTPATKLTPDDIKTDEEVLVTDRPGGVVDDPVYPLEQTSNPLANT